jgi:hypothetical protein
VTTIESLLGNGRKPRLTSAVTIIGEQINYLVLLLRYEENPKLISAVPRIGEQLN